MNVLTRFSPAISPIRRRLQRFFGRSSICILPLSLRARCHHQHCKTRIFPPRGRMETSQGEVRRGSGTDDYQPTHVVQGLILIQGLNARKLAPFGGGGASFHYLFSDWFMFDYFLDFKTAVLYLNLSFYPTSRVWNIYITVQSNFMVTSPHGTVWLTATGWWALQTGDCMILRKARIRWTVM